MSLRFFSITLMTWVSCLMLLGCKPKSFEDGSQKSDKDKKEDKENSAQKTQAVEIAQQDGNPPVKPSVEAEGLPIYGLLCSSAPGHVVAPPAEVIYCNFKEIKRTNL